jgi:7-cyano-7-deazaguanine synthase
MTRRGKVCVLASGGLDSSVLLAELLRRGYEVHPVYVRAGLRWERAERHFLGRLLERYKGPRLKPLTVLDVPLSGLLADHWSVAGRRVPAAGEAWDSVYLPGRNLILLSEAGLFCRLRGIPRLALATLKGNPFSDATPSFRRAMGRVISAATGAPVRVTAPYGRLTKEEALARVPGFPLELTFSCLKPRGLRPCGRCGKCGETRLLSRGLRARARAGAS